MSGLQVAFLGPTGTYAHITALKRYAREVELVAQPTIEHVFDFVKAGDGRFGLVPIENSSGGTIYNTVDLLIDPDYGLVITEELRLNVKLALLARDPRNIKTVYSHFAPFKHCDLWLRENLPGVRREEVASTGEAARIAAGDPTGAALGAHDAAELYGLTVIKYPVMQDVANVTQFVTVGRTSEAPAEGGRMSLVTALKNEPGSLASFLQALETVNMTRIISRPIHGQPGAFWFFIEIEGTRRDSRVAKVLETAGRRAVELRVIGEYPASLCYES